MDQIYEAIKEDMETALEKLQARERFEEENDFYICKTCQILCTFNQAVDVNFTCTDCGQVMEHFENEMLLRALKRRIRSIRESLGQA